MRSEQSRSRAAPASRSRRSRRRCRASPACAAASRSRARPTASSSWTTSRTTLPPSPAPARWPARRLWALFEPRSNTAGRKIFEEAYARAFSGADALVIGPVFHAKRLTPDAVMNRQGLTDRFTRAGKPALAPERLEEIPDFVRREARPRDVPIL